MTDSWWWSPIRETLASFLFNVRKLRGCGWMTVKDTEGESLASLETYGAVAAGSFMPSPKRKSWNLHVSAHVQRGKCCNEKIQQFNSFWSPQRLNRGGKFVSWKRERFGLQPDECAWLKMGQQYQKIQKESFLWVFPKSTSVFGCWDPGRELFVEERRRSHSWGLFSLFCSKEGMWGQAGWLTL